MKDPIEMNEAEMRDRFDFSKATRGRYADRYQQGHTITLLDRDPDEKQETAVAPAPVRKETPPRTITGKHRGGVSGLRRAKKP